MNNNTRKSSSPTKKRKANDGRATTDCEHDVNTGKNNDGGGFLSSWFGYFSGRRDEASSGLGSSPNENNMTQLNRMEEMMMRMEEKLATVSSLESRCEELERKCSSLENMLESTSKATKKHIDMKFDSLSFDLGQKCDSLAHRLEAKVESIHKHEADLALKRHEFNEMMLKNQSWEYSAAIKSVDHLVYVGCTEEEAKYVAETAEELKDLTTKMRRGEWPRGSHLHEMNGNLKGIYMEMSDSDPPFSYAVNNELLPHWKEFVAALKQFTPATNLLPDNCESYFSFYSVQLNHDAMYLVYEALMGMPFNWLDFTNNNIEDGVRGGMSVDAILDVVESNKHLRKLFIRRNLIVSQHIERLCSAVRNHHLVELDLFDSFEPGIGDEMLASLLTIDDLKLEKLGMASNHITSVGIAVVADFLATNPRLKHLDLRDNNLNDSDAQLIANALRGNMTLRDLNLEDNNFTDAGDEALHLVIYDDSSLNAVADSNHTCDANFIFSNWHENWRINKGGKIYYLLSCRNKTGSNAKHFDDLDVKILPNMLDAVQKYQNHANGHDLSIFRGAEPLSILFEIMRKWDKVFPLYKSLGEKRREVGVRELVE